jgi:SAM-dependent methyltransferase
LWVTSESERIVGLYQRHAAAFDRERSRHLFEKPTLDQFLLLLPPGASILDIGCGSAEPIARHLIDQGYNVTGVDSSPALIDLCRNRFADQQWIVADMRTLSLDRRFDGILAWDSFFHLCHEDQRAMFPIFRGHAAPRAALLFTSGPSHGEAIGTFQGEPLYHASLDAGEYQTLLDTTGFDLVAHMVEDYDRGGHTVWLGQAR